MVIGMTTAFGGNIHPNSHVIYELNLYNYTQEGTLKAAQQKLTELNDLGIDVVWLMPIHPRGKSDRIGKLGSPYAPSDYTAVNPDHGTLDDLKDYVAEAHRLGMEVWLDWVPNHTGTDNVWVKSHPDYYQMKNGQIVHPNNYGDVYQLNFQNTALQDAMIDAMQYWIDNADIDGFRCDYVSSSAIPAAFFTKCIAKLKNQPSGKKITMMGEADMNSNNTLRNTGWDYDYAWGFQSKLKEFGNRATAKTALLPSLQSLTNNDKYKNISRMVYLTNHDQNYEYSMNDANGANNYALTAIMMTLYGMPCIYNGQENGWLLTHKMDYFNRSVIDWNVKDDKMTNTIKVLAALKHSTAALADNDANRVGGVEYLETSENTCLAYQRKQGNETVMVVVNLANTPKTCNVSGLEAGDWQQIVDSRTVATLPEPKDITMNATQGIELEGKGYAVFAKGVTLGIDNVLQDNELTSNRRAKGIYDLNGRKLAAKSVAELPHGIYVVNGKKVVQ